VFFHVSPCGVVRDEEGEMVEGSEGCVCVSSSGEVGCKWEEVVCV